MVLKINADKETAPVVTVYSLIIINLWVVLLIGNFERLGVLICRDLSIDPEI